MLKIETNFPIQVLIRPEGSDFRADWQDHDYGPGTILLPEEGELAIRVKGIDDRQLAELVRELAHLDRLVFLNLSENRNVSNVGLAHLKGLPGNVRMLNLSSCTITCTGLDHLKKVPALRYLDLTYCNLLTDACVKPLRALTRLEFLDLQGCVKVTNAGVQRIKRNGLDIRK